jgi:dTMP kinase
LSPETGALDHRAEVLLYAADKAVHVETLVKPALASGKVVITDRYVDSALAYQGAGRDLEADDVEKIARWATSELRPHLTVLLDVEPSTGLGRFDAPDRIEAESMTFHERVRDSFLTLARDDPEHYLVVDARLGKEAIAEAVRQRIAGSLVLADRHVKADT